MWCSAADTHVKILERVVSGCSVLTGGVSECECAIAHWRSVAVSCIQKPKN